MSRKIRIPEPQFAEKRAPENARYSFFAVDGKIVQVIELPDGTRAHGRPDIDRIDVDMTPSGEVVDIVIHADASWPTSRRRKTLEEMMMNSAEAEVEAR